MNEHTETVLDYPRIKQELQASTVTPMGHLLAVELHPLADADRLEVLQRETSEMAELLDAGDAPPLSPVVDLQSYLSMISIEGFYLEPSQLLEVATCLDVIQRLRRYAQEASHRALLVSRRLSRLADCGILLRQIRSAINEQGYVRDQASVALQEVRHTLRHVRDRIQRRLHEMLARHRDVVQDEIVTIRNDRFVIPLKADFRRAIRGIVHGESASGATVYVEPEQIVDLNNQLLHAQAEEERAIREVLRQLTARVAVQRVGLVQALQILGDVDLTTAKGRLSLRMSGVAARFGAEGCLQLRAARHPYLSHAVPVDVNVEPDRRTLVITGPNTGGKTAVLKTVGLLVLMAQSGLHIPAQAESVLPIFTEVFVDVGDEQSLQQNLSTFSAHLANICSMLKGVTSRSLVLLDELGAGTDPMEGGPLGVALLESFQQSRAVLLVTTHHSTIKAFAVANPQTMCAAVDFDLDTLQPRYRLVYGLPGRSQAFAIAEKLGLPAAIIARAQHEMGAVQQRSEQLLAELENHRYVLDEDRQRLQAERAGVDRMKAEAEELLEQAKAEDVRIRQALYAEGQTLLKAVRQDLDATLADLRRQGPGPLSVDFPRDQWQQAVEAVSSLGAGQLETTLTEIAPWRVGDRVRVRGLNITGRVMAENAAHGTIQVEVGNKIITVPGANLERTDEAASPASQAAPKRARRVRREPVASDEGGSPALRLLGLTVDEALPAVDRYLDQAVTQGMLRVRLIHGVGSGRLREAIVELLRHHPLVRRFHAGDVSGGSTIVELEG
jgi:DNA mismatch repair protein MutS2